MPRFSWHLIALFFNFCLLPISSLLLWGSASIDLPSKLVLPAYATINEQILYLFGGYISDDTMNLPSDKIYKYDINIGSWMILPITIPDSIPIYCYQCTAIINQTLIYIITQHTNTIHIFDTTHDSFISSDDISTPLIPINGSYISVTNDSLGQFIYVISYQQSGPHSIPHLQRYNSYTNQWLRSRPFPFPSHGFTASMYHNNTLFVFAGHTKDCDQSTNQCTITNHDRICGYNVTIHLWTCYKAILQENKYGASVIMDNSNNKIYIIAGWSDTHYSNTVDIFDPNTLTSSATEPLPNIGGLVISTILNHQLIIFGGRNISSVSLQHIYSSLMLINVSEPTIDPTIIPTNSPSINPTASPSSNPSNNPTPNPTNIPSITPSISPSLNPTAIPTNSPSANPTVDPSITPSANPTISPSNTPTLLPTIIPSITPSFDPSNIPSMNPTIYPSIYPTKHPSIEPTLFTLSPSISPLVIPSVKPTKIVTLSPSYEPSSIPTINPSSTPSLQPTHKPSSDPSNIPSKEPSMSPSFAPYHNPTHSATIINPTVFPTNIPSSYHSLKPTYNPSVIPSNPPSNPPSNTPSIQPSQIPSNRPTSTPSIIPTKYPTSLPTYNPSVIPSISPTYSPSIQPPLIPSFDPTKATKSPKIPSKHPTKPPKTKDPTNSPSKTVIEPSLTFFFNSTNDLRSESVARTDVLSTHYRILWISGIISIILFIVSLLYLCIFTSKRTREIGQMKWKDFMKYSSILLKIGMVFEIADIITDYMYSVSLIRISTIGYSISSDHYELHKYDSVKTMAWISLICAVTGSLLFICEVMLARKLYSKIPILREELKRYNKIECDDMMTSPTVISHSHYNIIHAIRIRKVDIDIFAILVSCFEDIPQITIIIVVTLILSQWTQFSVLSLMLSISSCTMKCLKVMVDKFGCGDDPIDVFGYQDVNSLDASSTTVSISTIKDRKINLNDVLSDTYNDDDDDDDDDDHENDDDDECMQSQHNKINLMDDSDEEEMDPNEYDEIDSEEVDIIYGEQEISNNNKKKSNNRRPLRISRRATFRKHKLLMIPEETDDGADWSEFDDAI